MWSLTRTRTRTATTATILIIQYAIVGSVVEAFQNSPLTNNNFGGTSTSSSSSSSSSSSALHAVLPPMIISPIIKKFREDQAKKKAPMATRDEAKIEAPGLRVGQNVWKWPPVWPYDELFFTPPEDIPKPKGPQVNDMAGMLSGIPNFQAPGQADGDTTKEEEEEEDTKKLNALNYWGVENKEVTTDLDPDAAAKLTSHYEFYLKDGMSILEIGAAEESYLPEGLKLSRHVGVGANQYLMDKNPSLTESMVVDLNKVIPEQDVDNDDLRALASEPFDAIIMANTVDFLVFPREVFRSAWYLLKPGGIMINAFSTKEMYKNKFQRAQTGMWRQYNDDQHMWICGSFFAFSAGDGWERLQGFDISPDNAKVDADGFLSKLAQGKANNIYTVQAYKNAGYSDDDDETTIKDVAGLEKYINSKMWMLPGLERRDKDLLTNRLVRAIQTSEANKEDIPKVITRNIEHLPKIFACLSKMDQFAFTYSMQTQLATDLVCDPSFNGNDEQILALKQGLGLRTPSEEFWLPVGTQTSGMEVEDKISLLAFIVPKFGSNDPKQEEALETFVTGMKPMFEVLRKRLPDISEADVQLLGTELLAAEVLVPGRSSRFEFATWVGNELSDQDLRDFLMARKQIRIDATQDMFDFQDRRAQAKKAYEEQQEKMKEQVAQARKERSMIFNPRTTKFEVYDKK